MKFQADRDALLTVLSTANRATGMRSTLGAPVIQVELLDGNLIATGSDSDLTISRSVQVDHDGDGLTRFPARLITDIVKSLEPGAVNVSVADDEAVIAGGRAEFSLRVPIAADVTSTPVDGEEVIVSGASFAEGLRQVVPAALSDDTRAPQLTGVLIEQRDNGVRLVATDSYRLAIKDVGGVTFGDQQLGSALVPSRALAELRNLLDDAEKFTLRRSELGAQFDVGDSTILTRLLRGPFPDYERLLPKEYPSAFTTDRNELVEAIKRMRIMLSGSKDTTTPVRLTFAQSSLTFEVKTAEVGIASETVDGELYGEGGLVAFNPSYLLDCLAAATGDSATMSFIDASKPALVVGSDDGWQGLLMPVKVN